jgi:hypothetical protein
MRMQVCPVFTQNERKDPRVFAAIPVTTKWRAAALGDASCRRFSSSEQTNQQIDITHNQQGIGHTHAGQDELHHQCRI